MAADPVTYYRTVTVGDVKVFYREAGDPKKPALLLLHGFPTSSHMFRNLIPLLADRYHVIAPDYPGFGFSDAPDRAQFKYTFEHLAEVMDGFTQSGRSQALCHVHLRLRRADRDCGWRWRIRSASPPSSRRTATPTRRA